MMDYWLSNYFWTQFCPLDQKLYDCTEYKKFTNRNDAIVRRCEWDEYGSSNNPVAMEQHSYGNTSKKQYYFGATGPGNQQHHKISRCRYCWEREESNKCITLEDGRILCPSCSSTAVLDETQLKIVIDKVDILFRECKLVIKREFPILLAAEGYKTDIYGEHKDLKFSDWTYYSEEVVKTVKSYRQQGQKIFVTKEYRKLEERKNTRGSSHGAKERMATGIVILYGYPRVLTGRFLAHEMMHAWMYSQGVSDGLAPEIKEGLCEVMAYKWLGWAEREGRNCGLYSKSEEAHAKKLIRLHMHWMLTSSSKIYGQGFRDAMARVDKLGLNKTLIYVARYKMLPYVAGNTIPVIPLD